MQSTDLHGKNQGRLKRSAMWGTAIGSAGCYLWAMPRIRCEYREEGHLRGVTAGVVYLSYSLHLAAFVLGVTSRSRLLKPPKVERLTRNVLGWPLAAGGVALFVSGWRSLPTADDSALATSGLHTRGVYRFSRNPQNVGWVILLAGVSLLRRSWAGTLLSGLFWAMFANYLPSEEAFLEQTYGASYLDYKIRTPRFLGWRPE